MPDVRIFLNGESRDIPTGVSLEDVLNRFSLPQQRVAVELNKSVVRRADWPNTKIGEGDRLEVVHFVGGG